MHDIVYLAQDIPPFVMYCVYGESGSSLLIESTDSMMILDCFSFFDVFCSSIYIYICILASKSIVYYYNYSEVTTVTFIYF